MLHSCKKENDELKTETLESINKKDEILYEKLLKAGFKSENIKDLGDSYIFEGDMLFKKNNTNMEYFDKYFNFDRNGKRPNSNETKQWSTQNVISSDESERIKVNISTEHSVMSQALSNWASIPSTTLSFYAGKHIFTNDNKIEVVNESLSGLYALAEFPQNGQVGFRIQIDNNAFSSLTFAQRVMVLTHEIGHCLGLRHTDNPGSDSFGTALVPGTPTTDSQSIMNTPSPVPAWSQFSNYDQITAQYLYPTNSNSGIITSPATKYPNIQLTLADYGLNYSIQWDASRISSSTVTLQLYQFGVLKATIATNTANDGEFSYALTDNLARDTTNDHYTSEVQIKIVDDNNSANYDLTPLFYIYVD